MLIFPLSRQLQIQTECYHCELTAHTYTQKPIFLPMVFTGMLLLMGCQMVIFEFLPKCLYKPLEDHSPTPELAFNLSSTEL